MQRGRNFSVREPLTQPDPLERAEAVQGTWQLLWAGAARRRARLQTALLIGQVERSGRGGAGRDVRRLDVLGPASSKHFFYLPTVLF